MAQITIGELFWGQKYAIHDKANMAYGKRLSQGKVKDPLAGLMMEYVRQTLIAAEQMKKTASVLPGMSSGIRSPFLYRRGKILEEIKCPASGMMADQ